MTPSFREENIEGPRIYPLSCFSFLYESANCLAQCARVFEQGGLPKMGETILNRPAGAREPLQDIAVALQGIDQFSLDTPHRIQNIQCGMVAHHPGLIRLNRSHMA